MKSKIGTNWVLRVAAMTIVFALGAAAAAGCGSDSDDGSATATTAGASFDKAAFLAENEKRLEANFKGTDGALPTSAPAPEAGKKVWIISCGQLAEGCASGGAGAQEAGKALGWDVTVVDGKMNPQVWNEGIRQAIAAQADAVVLDAVDCNPVKGALDQARAAGLKVFAWYSFDCDDSDPAATPRYDGQVDYGPGYKSFKDWLFGYGASMADWMIAKTDGEAKAIVFEDDDLLAAKYFTDGFDQRFAECETCEVVAREQFTLSELGSTLQQKASTLLNQHPEANAVYGLLDSAMQLGIAQAVAASGRSDELFVTGSEGYATNVEMVRDNKGQDFIAGSPSRWVAWAAMDGLNRVFNGAPPAGSGIGFQSSDAERNLPPDGQAYDGTEDYEANYRKIWGGE